ncbi:MAG: non-hydrolyzing UDP-N-acetylglucosamine 2-epimerase [Betaproteobacteria bacterium]
MTAPGPRRANGALVCVVGARPNFMKMAPILRALATQAPGMTRLLVHTGQHYDSAMSGRFFSDLGLPQPDIDLGVGSGSHALQTAEIMQRFEPLLDAHPAAGVLVVGDVNSTLACALVACKKNIPVFHVEAGLRSGDRAMPEEINRLLTDRIASRLYTTEREAGDNLLKEGVAAEAICFAGNVMIDSLHHALKKAIPAAETLAAAGLPTCLPEAPAGYGLLTLHRPSNVDDPRTLGSLLETMASVSTLLPLVFVAHPRTHNNIEKFGLHALVRHPGIAMLPPQGYFEMLGLMAGARVVLTDSGGMQEETTALGVPCLTLRDNTERPITVSQGTNRVVGNNGEIILSAVRDILAGQGKKGHIPELWDGHAAERIVSDLMQWLHS